MSNIAATDRDYRARSSNEARALRSSSNRPWPANRLGLSRVNPSYPSGYIFQRTLAKTWSLCSEITRGGRCLRILSLRRRRHRRRRRSRRERALCINGGDNAPVHARCAALNHTPWHAALLSCGVELLRPAGKWVWWNDFARFVPSRVGANRFLEIFLPAVATIFSFFFFFLSLCECIYLW